MVDRLRLSFIRGSARTGACRVETHLDAYLEGIARRTVASGWPSAQRARYTYDQPVLAGIRTSSRVALD